jgi:hypothetical protein
VGNTDSDARLRRGLQEMRDYFDFWEHELLPIFFEKLEQRQMTKGEP